MPDIFISFTDTDKQFANFLHRHLIAEGLDVFLASASLKPGQQWATEILTALRHSKWVLCLASQAACRSPWVMQEMGAAIGSQKKIIPIVWDMPPSSLPGWMQHYQALNLAGASNKDVVQSLTLIANQIKAENKVPLVIAAFLLAGLWIFGKK